MTLYLLALPLMTQSSKGVQEELQVEISDLKLFDQDQQAPLAVTE
jgi:hypothetical protein